MPTPGMRTELRAAREQRHERVHEAVRQDQVEQRRQAEEEREAAHRTDGEQ